MARTVDEATHELRRDAFIDAMERLLVTKGFQAVTVADVLRETGASKGAFYHYFESKAALLAAMLERALERIVEAVEPVMASEVTAVRKLDEFIAVLAQWKSARKALMLAAGRAWYSEDNALPREKLRRLSRYRVARLLARIIRQGNAEGVFAAPDPETCARLAVVILQDLQEFLADWVIGRRPDSAELPEIHARIATYDAAVERLLGATPDTIHIVPEAVIDAWLTN